jgi:hypothetical protein
VCAWEQEFHLQQLQFPLLKCLTVWRMSWEQNEYSY